MRLRDWPNLRTACLAILTELEREFFSRKTFTELRQSTGLSQAEVEWTLAELKSRKLVGMGLGGYERIYVPDAKPLV